MFTGREGAAKFEQLSSLADNQHDNLCEVPEESSWNLTRQKTDWKVGDPVEVTLNLKMYVYYLW